MEELGMHSDSTEILKELNWEHVVILGDGNCYYRSIETLEHHYLNTNRTWQEIKAEILAFMTTDPQFSVLLDTHFPHSETPDNAETFSSKEDYLEYARIDGHYADGNMLSAYTIIHPFIRIQLADLRPNSRAYVAGESGRLTSTISFRGNEEDNHVIFRLIHCGAGRQTHYNVAYPVDVPASQEEDIDPSMPTAGISASGTAAEGNEESAINNDKSINNSESKKAWVPRRVHLVCEDYAQPVTVPHFGWQRPSIDYYTSNLNLNLFNISDCSNDIDNVLAYLETTAGKTSSDVCSLRWRYFQMLYQECLKQKIYLFQYF
jgi:hypothetical protein